MLHGHGIVEIPCATLLHVCSGILIGIDVAHTTVLLLVLLVERLCDTVALLFLLLLQRLDDAVDGCVTVLLTHLGQCLQGILQMDGLCIRCKFVEHLRALCQLGIVLTLLIEQSEGIGITPASIAPLMTFPIESTQTEQEHAFLHTPTRGLSVAQLILANRFRRVFLCQIDIAQGIVHLIEIVLIVVGTCHALELTDHLPALRGSQHLTEGYACIESQLVRRIKPGHTPISLRSLSVVSKGSLKLPKEIILTRFLLAPHLMTDDTPQIFHGLLIVARMDIIVGVGIIPLLLCAPMDGVALHIADHILSIVEQVVLHIRLRKPGTGPSVDGRLGGVDTAHVGKGGCSGIKIAFVKLGTSQQEPCLPQERVVLAAVEPFDILGGLTPVFVPFRTFLDAMELNSLLRLLYGLVKIGLPQITARLIADGI